MTVEEQYTGGYDKKNIPFVQSLFLIDRLDVFSVMDPVRHKLPDASPSRIPFGGIVLETGTMITRMKFPPLACTFNQTLTRGSGGLVSSVAIDFGFPASQENVMDWYHTTMEKQFVCLVQDANMQSYLVGNEERGVRVSMNQAVGAVNQHVLNLSGVFALPIFLITTAPGGIVLADMFPDTDFSIDFSLDFSA